MLARVRDRNILGVYGVILLVGIAYGLSIAVLAIHMRREGIAKTDMGGLAMAFALGIVALSIPAGALIRAVGGKRALVVALVAYAACVGSFPFVHSVATLSLVRFFDGASSVAVWVACETILLARADARHKAFVMSLYAVAMALGYVIGPVASKLIVAVASPRAAFVTAATLAMGAACVAALVIDHDAATRHDGDATTRDDTSGDGWRLVLRRVRTSCAATFAYGYFQASLVIFLPLYLIEAKHVPEGDTILVTAFFAAGMLLCSNAIGRVADRVGHLSTMRRLALVGAAMTASFVVLDRFAWMCGAVFVAGATLATISPISLALQGVVTPKRDLSRANALYNAFYASGMLLGPLVTSALFQRHGGAAMLLHLAALWTLFVVFATVARHDDPRARRAADRAG